MSLKIMNCIYRVTYGVYYFLLKKAGTGYVILTIKCFASAVAQDRPLSVVRVLFDSDKQLMSYCLFIFSSNQPVHHMSSQILLILTAFSTTFAMILDFFKPS